VTAPRDVVLVGVPTNSSGTADGVARAPGVLRERGLAAALGRRPGFTDAGDLALPAPQPRRGPSGLLAEDALLAMIGQVREAVRAARRDRRFPLLIGGDCPVIAGALAALRAVQRGQPDPLGELQVVADHHPDPAEPGRHHRRRRAARGEPQRFLIPQVRLAVDAAQPAGVRQCRAGPPPEGDRYGITTAASGAADAGTGASGAPAGTG
jgi:arginase family enzyme